MFAGPPSLANGKYVGRVRVIDATSEVYGAIVYVTARDVSQINGRRGDNKVMVVYKLQINGDVYRFEPHHLEVYSAPPVAAPSRVRSAVSSATQPTTESASAFQYTAYAGETESPSIRFSSRSAAAHDLESSTNRGGRGARRMGAGRRATPDTQDSHGGYHYPNPTYPAQHRATAEGETSHPSTRGYGAPGGTGQRDSQGSAWSGRESFGYLAPIVQESASPTRAGYPQGYGQPSPGRAHSGPSNRSSDDPYRTEPPISPSQLAHGSQAYGPPAQRLSTDSQGSRPLSFDYPLMATTAPVYRAPQAYPASVTSRNSGSSQGHGRGMRRAPRPPSDEED